MPETLGTAPARSRPIRRRTRAETRSFGTEEQEFGTEKALPSAPFGQDLARTGERQRERRLDVLLAQMLVELRPLKQRARLLTHAAKDQRSARIVQFVGQAL